MISMTWPQYRRCECTLVAHLSPQEAELLAALLMRHPDPVPTSDLIEAVWSDPDAEPECADSQIRIHVCHLRCKGLRIAASPQGYRLDMAA